MRFLFSFFLLMGFLSGFFPTVVLADTTADPYADSVVSSSNQTYQPTHAVGTPDGSSLTFFTKDASITLDMGEGEEGTGDLYLYVEILNYGARYWVDFWNAEKNTIIYKGDTIPAMTPKITVPFAETTPYRYVRIRSDAASQWKLDAVEAKSYVSPSPLPSTEPLLSSPPTAESPATTPTTGDLVKLPDDGNPGTTYDSAIYTIGADGKRHAFPNETTFLSWYKDYSGVKTVSAETMATYALGANVTIRPGTHLVKITTDPKTYAVEPGGKLRWITTEQLAKDLYGSEWMKKVVDVPDVFFKNYTMGEDVTASNSSTLVTISPSDYPF